MHFLEIRHWGTKYAEYYAKVHESEQLEFARQRRG